MSYTEKLVFEAEFLTKNIKLLTREGEEGT